MQNNESQVYPESQMYTNSRISNPYQPIAEQPAFYTSSADKYDFSQPQSNLNNLMMGQSNFQAISNQLAQESNQTPNNPMNLANSNLIGINSMNSSSLNVIHPNAMNSNGMNSNGMSSNGMNLNAKNLGNPGILPNAMNQTNQINQNMMKSNNPMNQNMQQLQPQNSNFMSRLEYAQFQSQNQDIPSDLLGRKQNLGGLNGNQDWREDVPITARTQSLFNALNSPKPMSGYPRSG